VDALRGGDEAAFADLMRRYTAPMTSVAMLYVTSHAVAEEVVQDAWMSVVRGLDRFEGRSSLRTWIFTILANCARKRAAREGRCVPFSALPGGQEPLEPPPEPDPFTPAEHPRWSRIWTTPNDAWDALPEERVLGRECVDAVRDAIADLPPRLREVMTLRDVAGWSSREVAEALGISDENQRVRLHRARARVRSALEGYLGAPGGSA
jgi:RNA polymerase sigma-70 factor (ECF subfamily)